jgi:RHS repeat-associated protein
MYFEYDGLNRQVSRRIGANGTRTFNVWDGWDLIEEYRAANSGATTAAYLYGATGLISQATNGQLYYLYQDGSGSTSHVANGSGVLQEWYRYDLQGAAFFYNATDNQLTASGLGVRHLFTGQQWYQELGLYDLRNRFYSPDVGRFLQPDPIGFRGGNNLYRYCGNNAVTGRDPFGLEMPGLHIDGNGAGNVAPVVVTGSEIPLPQLPDIPIFLLRPPDMNFPSPFGGLPPSGGGHAGRDSGAKRDSGQPSSPSNNTSTNPQQPPPQNPQQTLANSPATTFLGKFLQSFNSQGGWKETADTLDSFAAFEANLLLFGEGRVAWGVGRYALGPAVRATFAQGTIQSTVLQRPMTVFRFWGGRSPQISPYFTTADTVTQISSPEAARIALNLPGSNLATQLDGFVIPAGTRIYYGGIAGGADTATQVYIMNPEVVMVVAP